MPRNPAATYPNTTLQTRMQDAGISCKLLWEIPGPPGTLVDWLSCYQIGQSVCIVQTFKGNNGWNAMTPPFINGVDETVKDVVARCAAKREF